MGDPAIIERRLFGRDGAGLCCDGDGLALGPVPLVAVSGAARGRRQFRLRPAAEITKALQLAFGPLSEEAIERSPATFERIAAFLNDGEIACAAIAAVRLGLPEIGADGMAKLAVAASLQKYNPDWQEEPRMPAGGSAGGQWTGDSGDVQVAAAGDLHCQRIAGGCESGGSFGSTAMFRILGRDLCMDCAVKMMDFGNIPREHQWKELERYLIK